MTTRKRDTPAPVGRPLKNEPHPINPVPGSKWEAFGRAVLDFHRRVAHTAMCQCGTPMQVCDVWAQAAQYGIRTETE